MKSKCYSVRLKSLIQISAKCFKAEAFDGSEALIPASQIFGIDYDVSTSNAFWISAWILEQKKLQYSSKKAGWYDPESGQIRPHIIIEHHIPKKMSMSEYFKSKSINEIIKEL